MRGATRLSTKPAGGALLSTLALALALLLTGTACSSHQQTSAVPSLVPTTASTTSPASLAESTAQLQRAVAFARQSVTHRVRGELGSTASVLRWEGYVVGNDEQYVMSAGGVLIDSRRVAGVNYARRISADEQTWERVPPDRPIDLAVLLLGTPTNVQHVDGAVVVTLHFNGVNILGALTHVPNVGSSTADVTLKGDSVDRVELHFANNAAAKIMYWDYGVRLTVDPVPNPQ